jgi:hypothetical protein
MRKIRENLLAFGGRVAMVTLTAPGQDAGLVWDRAVCVHAADKRCDGRKGCRVVKGAAALWNEDSRKQWRELNRIAKQHADRALRKLGSDRKGGLLVYEWELQKRGVWHLHIVLSVETAVERAWAIAYGTALRAVGQSKGFGFVDLKPLRKPQHALQVASYLSKYLAKWREDGSFEVSETVTSAGRSLLNYVSRGLTGRTGCTMRALRNVRLIWAWREGLIRELWLDPMDFMIALCLLEPSTPARAP